MNMSALIDQQIDRVLSHQVMEPDPAFVERTRQIVLLHAQMTYPLKSSFWKRWLGPIVFAGVSLASLVIIVGQVQRSRMSEIDRIQDDLNHITIQEE